MRASSAVCFIHLFFWRRQNKGFSRNRWLNSRCADVNQSSREAHTGCTDARSISRRRWNKSNRKLIFRANFLGNQFIITNNMKKTGNSWRWRRFLCSMDGPRKWNIKRRFGSFWSAFTPTNSVGAFFNLTVGYATGHFGRQCRADVRVLLVSGLTEFVHFGTTMTNTNHFSTFRRHLGIDWDSGIFAPANGVTAQFLMG